MNRMLLRIEKPRLLSEAIAIISELVTEVRLRVDKNGLSIVAIDPANVALVSFRLPRENFTEFEADEEVIGLNLENLKAVLKRAGSGMPVVLQTEENMLRVVIQDKIKREFALALIDIDTEEKTMPSLEFSCKVELNSQDIVDIINDCAIVADSCIFEVKEGKFMIEAKGSLNATRAEFSGDEAKIQGKDARAKYSIEYLEKFIKAAKFSEKAILEFSTDYPMKLEFKSNEIEIAFILAPRVEEE